MVFVLLAAFRFSLTDKGHRFDADEYRYLAAVRCWEDVYQGRFSKAVGDIFFPIARPGFTLTYLLPAALQHMLPRGGRVDFDAAPYTIASMQNAGVALEPYNLVSMWNAGITLINSFLFYRILLLAVSSPGLALAGTIVYSLLVNTNLYIRHLFPYDASMMCFLLALLWILRAGKEGAISAGRVAACGALSTWGALVYPGYYILVPVLAVILWMSVRDKFCALGIYFLVFIDLVCLTEVFAWSGEASYFRDLFKLMPTVNHGSFAEGFLFIFRYMRDVEGFVGLALLALFLVYVIGYLRRDKGPIPWLIGLVTVAYAAQAVSGLLFQKFVFYGRTLHMYFPFLVIGAMRLLTLLPTGRLRKVAVGVLLSYSFVSFMVFAAAYSRLSYPADVFFRYLKQVPSRNILYLDPGYPVFGSLHKKYAAAAVNFISYWDVIPKEEFVPEIPANLKLVVDEPHPLNFMAYTFENYSDTDRAIIHNRRYRMQIYMDPRYGPKR